MEWARGTHAAWDGTYHRSSPEAALHYYWPRVMPDSVFLVDGSSSGSRHSAAAATALGAAVDSLRARLGTDREEWRWGRIHRSELPHAFVRAYDLGAVERNGGGGTVAATGATFRFIVDFSDFDSSRVTNAPGQSGQPESAFYGNPVRVWGGGGYFPLAWSREALEQGAKYRQVLSASY